MEFHCGRSNAISTPAWHSLARAGLARPGDGDNEITHEAPRVWSVTSVPVVSKIFADLKILHTRFARLVLGVAVLEDIVLWLALAVATALAGKALQLQQRQDKPTNVQRRTA